MRALVGPLPRALTQALSVLVLAAWIATIGVLVNRSYLQASSATLATDLARYGSAATWRGVYYRGEKIGFTVSQTVPEGDGFELQEDGRLQMALLGATTAATIRTDAHVDRAFALRAFEFSLDPGTGKVEVRGRLDGRRLSLEVRTAFSVFEVGGAGFVVEPGYPAAQTKLIVVEARIASESLKCGNFFIRCLSCLKISGRP